MNFKRGRSPDGLPTLRLRGETAEEHEWLGQLCSGRPVTATRPNDLSVEITVCQPVGQAGEASSLSAMAPVATIAPNSYDEAPLEDLITEAVIRGLNPYDSKGKDRSRKVVVEMLRASDSKRA